MSKKRIPFGIDELLKILKDQKINTWFDLGLFLDRFKDQSSKAAFKESAKSFDEHIERGGIAFMTFFLGIDGITVEIEKYAKTFKNIYPNIPI